MMYENDFSSSLDYGQLSDPTFGIGSEYTIPDSTGGKRRVRIALKSMPQAGKEGGEWEVQICWCYAQKKDRSNNYGQVLGTVSYNLYYNFVYSL